MPVHSLGTSAGRASTADTGAITGSRRLRRAALLACCALGRACSLRAAYKVSDSTAPAPAHYQGRRAMEGRRAPGSAPRGAWWSLFQRSRARRPRGSKLRHSNLDSARPPFARLQQARARYRIRARRSVSARRLRSPPRRASASPSTPRGSRRANRRPSTISSVGADVSYEFDLWGRVRNQVAAARANQQASAADLASARALAARRTRRRLFQPAGRRCSDAGCSIKRSRTTASPWT